MSTFLSKVGKIVPVKSIFFLKKIFPYYFSNLKFCPTLPDHMRFLAKWVHAVRGMSLTGDRVVQNFVCVVRYIGRLVLTALSGYTPAISAKTSYL